jgi:ribosome-associated protein
VIISFKIDNLNDSKQVCDFIIAALDDDKAEQIVSVNLAGKTSIADYMVIASGMSQRHVGALAEKLAASLKEEGVKVGPIEGKEQCEWVLVDTGDVIVHLFRPEVREHYNLEKLWSIPTPELEIELVR